MADASTRTVSKRTVGGGTRTVTHGAQPSADNPFAEEPHDHALIREDPQDSGASATTAFLAQRTDSEVYDGEKIDFFIGFSIVMALAFEGSQQAKLEHKHLSIAWVVAAMLELLIVTGFYIFVVFAGGTKGFLKKVYIFAHFPVLLFVFALLIWNIVMEAK